MSLGLEQAGFDVQLGIDLDPVNVVGHEFNFPRTQCLPADLRDLDATAVESQLSQRSPPVLVAGGPSCQGFSEIGNRQSADPRNTLVGTFIDLAVSLWPPAIVMENVVGLVHEQNVRVFNDAVEKLASAGYDTIGGRTPLILDAGDYGVPQSRRRVFIVALRRDARGRSDEHLLGWLKNRRSSLITCAEAIGDLPNANRYPTLLDRHALSDAQGRLGTPSDYARDLRALRQGKAHARRPKDAAALTHMQRTRHSDAVIKRFRRTAPGEVDSGSRLPRLSPDGLAPTLRAGTSRDHGSYTAARPIHYRYPRVITVREAARLHSYPDWFRFHDAKWHALRQIGNSVPPRLAQVVGELVLEGLQIESTVGRLDLDLPEDDSPLSMSLNRAGEHVGLARGLLPVDVRRAAAEGKSDD